MPFLLHLVINEFFYAFLSELYLIIAFPHDNFSGSNKWLRRYQINVVI